ncbi:uncharacterized protein N7477_006693 [Penicillium maclennaniae]|uniref:uncharacterized protein n=1 Tax=Penicillium maclennaniae TaxID=1343394 RepID=UPI002540B85B|nr:uncharacterized protein N7477_006693 [Penicillium maclennaniae]KAJ5668123.1 hypothetical protein N7477_006693 [Penicillium maclennaniae]
MMIYTTAFFTLFSLLLALDARKVAPIVVSFHLPIAQLMTLSPSTKHLHDAPPTRLLSSKKVSIIMSFSPSAQQI